MAVTGTGAPGVYVRPSTRSGSSPFATPLDCLEAHLPPVADAQTASALHTPYREPGGMQSDRPRAPTERKLRRCAGQLPRNP